MNALKLERPVLAGYDWGGRAACIVAALHPGRVRGLVCGDGYNIQNIAGSAHPASPENEHRKWYQFYFHGARGRAGLEANRRAFCLLLWKLWSPSWRFDEAKFERTAVAFDNPDFVEVTIHSYRHRYGLVPGDPAFDEIEHRLREQPSIDVPSISLDGDDDGVMNAGGAADHAHHFTGQHEYRRIPGCGHNIPQEKPDDFADAVLTVERWTRDAP
jgi:pimeloyl-ACP methyl ester carboxylesterase